MMFVHTLGTALIDTEEAHVTPSAGRRFALLLHLSAEAGRRVPRSTLNALMFPDQPDRNARHSLRELVYQCRQLGVQIASDADGIELAVEDAQTDHGAVISADRLNLRQLKAIASGFLPG
jgi:DNA-binding SARP family transcriptional activator